MSDPSSVEGAARRLGEAGVTPAELAQIAAAYPALRGLVAQHPASYPELRAWIAGQVAPPAATLAAAPQPAYEVPPTAAPAVPAAGMPLTAVPVAGVPAAATPASGARRGGAGWLPWAVAGLAVVLAVVSWVVPHGGQVAQPAAPSAAAPSSSADASSSAGPSSSVGATVAEPGVEHGSDTPEAAIQFLADRLAAGDPAGAAGAFAIDSLVAGYDFQAYANRLQVVSGANLLLPASGDYFRTIDVMGRRGQAANQLEFFTLSVVAPQYGGFLEAVPLTGDTTAASVEKELDSSRMSGLSVVRADRLQRAGLAESDAAAWAVYGAAEAAEYAVLYQTPTGTAAGGVTVVRYGSAWYIANLTAPVLGLDVGQPGMLEPMGESDYQALVAR